jgi:nucleoid-associated protein YgaU
LFNNSKKFLLHRENSMRGQVVVGTILCLFALQGFAQDIHVSTGTPQTSQPSIQNEEPAAPPQGIAAQTQPPAGSQTYTVWLWQETRDSLWTLAEKFYGDPWMWKKIYLANKHQIEDPAIIYPKQVLIIPPLDESDKKR